MKRVSLAKFWCIGVEVDILEWVNYESSWKGMKVKHGRGTYPQVIMKSWDQFVGLKEKSYPVAK